MFTSSRLWSVPNSLTQSRINEFQKMVRCYHITSLSLLSIYLLKQTFSTQKQSVFVFVYGNTILCTCKLNILMEKRAFISEILLHRLSFPLNSLNGKASIIIKLKENVCFLPKHFPLWHIFLSPSHDIPSGSKAK